MKFVLDDRRNRPYEVEAASRDEAVKMGQNYEADVYANASIETKGATHGHLIENVSGERIYSRD